MPRFEDARPPDLGAYALLQAECNRVPRALSATRFRSIAGSWQCSLRGQGSLPQEQRQATHQRRTHLRVEQHTEPRREEPAQIRAEFAEDAADSPGREEARGVVVVAVVVVEPRFAPRSCAAAQCDPEPHLEQQKVVRVGGHGHPRNVVRHFGDSVAEPQVDERPPQRVAEVRKIEASIEQELDPGALKALRDIALMQTTEYEIYVIVALAELTGLESDQAISCFDAVAHVLRIGRKPSGRCEPEVT